MLLAVRRGVGGIVDVGCACVEEVAVGQFDAFGEGGEAADG